MRGAWSLLAVLLYTSFRNQNEPHSLRDAMIQGSTAWSLLGVIYHIVSSGVLLGARIDLTLNGML